MTDLMMSRSKLCGHEVDVAVLGALRVNLFVGLVQFVEFLDEYE
jgi:hypothetical protein